MAGNREALIERIENYLMQYDAIQQQWQELLGRQQHVLAASKADELRALCDQEASLALELKGLLSLRMQLLAQGESLGFPADSLRQLAILLAPADKSLAQKIQSLQWQADLLRRSTWSHWISCQKSVLHYAQLVQLIANGGRKSSLYGNQLNKGGAIVDASV